MKRTRVLTMEVAAVAVEVAEAPTVPTTILLVVLEVVQFLGALVRSHRASPRLLVARTTSVQPVVLGLMAQLVLPARSHKILALLSTYQVLQVQEILCHRL